MDIMNYAARASMLPVLAYIIALLLYNLLLRVQMGTMSWDDEVE
jgi:hypothetical protein